MGAVVVVGTHWGDEAKGKLVDLLAQDAELVIRYGGGPNAGHTVHVGESTYKFHLIPSGILNPKTLSIMADGMVIAPATLVREIETLQGVGIDTSNLRISHNAHVILPYHRLLDQLEEKLKGAGAIGTTGRGVGPCYADKASRVGVRMGDLIDPKRLRERLTASLPLKNAILTKVFEVEAVELEALIAELTPLGEKLAHYVCDTQALAGEALEANKRILFEGAQATMLDIDGGTYPFVTSSHPISGGACIGTGVPPTAISEILGVVKAYTSRVGAGTVPTELLDERGDKIRERGNEYGTTTGRPRRIGWLDGFALQYAARVNGLTGICIGHLDVLAGFETINICIGYTKNGVLLKHFPAGDVCLMDGCEPVYEALPGWPEDSIDNITRFEDLPTNAQAYVRRVEQLAGVPARFVSIGPRRDQTLLTPNSPAPAQLFANHKTPNLIER
ncbi:adenylosuccinate synthase [Armatimonas sp.]|uniref:adenylosuccinate synthase n=1 Tax=Armatimonas sp. TaxID=1872638 RepID=UPI00286B06BA|nr:adenylosuccinate synthase [Armatimonas sp.]